tara:strand:+ start:283 stop:453 length:171 start_codon:yes stop_codon:yes gene_type:complete
MFAFVALGGSLFFALPNRPPFGFTALGGSLDGSLFTALFTALLFISSSLRAESYSV